MIIKNKNGKELTSFSKWEDGFKEVDDQGELHWAPGYSAYSLGLFFTSGAGEYWLNALSESLFGERVVWIDARIEHKSKLDRNKGKHRMQDMALWGSLLSGEKVFMAIEAKVLESFGERTLSEEYDETLRYQKFVKPTTKRPDRVKKVTDFLFPGKTPYDKDIRDLRYQLMYYFMGSVLEASTYSESIIPLSQRKSKVDIVLLPILVFKTEHYYSDTGKANSNKDDYLEFCRAVGLRKEIIRGKEWWVGEISGRRVYSCYETIELM